MSWIQRKSINLYKQNILRLFTIRTFLWNSTNRPAFPISVFFCGLLCKIMKALLKLLVSVSLFAFTDRLHWCPIFKSRQWNSFKIGQFLDERHDARSPNELQKNWLIKHGTTTTVPVIAAQRRAPFAQTHIYADVVAMTKREISSFGEGNNPMLKRIDITYFSMRSSYKCWI